MEGGSESIRYEIINKQCYKNQEKIVRVKIYGAMLVRVEGLYNVDFKSWLIYLPTQGLCSPVHVPSVLQNRKVDWSGVPSNK